MFLVLTCRGQNLSPGDLALQSIPRDPAVKLDLKLVANYPL